MSVFEFCLEIIKREGKRFNVGVNTTTASQITASTASDVNFDIAHNRCAFLYRCGAINLSFAKDCFKQFLLDEKSKSLLKWDTCADLTVCSFSNGPALDYIALLLTYQECNILPPLFKNVKVISRYGAWRNTANIMFDILKEGYLTCLSPAVPIGDVEVIQGDLFVEFNEKVNQPISNSDVVLMFKALNLQGDGYDQVKVSQVLKEFLGILKPGAIIFCIDTKPSIAVITHHLCSFAGKFLFEPTFMNTSINLEHTDFYKDIFGCFPVINARGSFFVWQKIHKSRSLECLLDEVKESFKNQLKLNNNQDNICCSKSSEDSYSKLCENSFGKQQIASTSKNFCENTFCDVSKNLKSADSNSSSQPLDKDHMDKPSKCFTVESPLKNSILSYDCLNKENGALFKPSISSNPVSINQAVQTDPEDLKGTGSTRMNELNNRIAKLTIKISEMLNTSELDECQEDFLKVEKTECKLTDSDDCIHNHHSSISRCIHNSTCKKSLQSVENCCNCCKCCRMKIFENCCQNHACHQLQQSTPKQYSSSAAINDDSSCHNRLKFSTENNSASVPKLVIPLNNLSGSAISQILSIIAQSNQEQ